MSTNIDTDGTNDDDVEHLIEAAAEHGRQSEDFDEEGRPHSVGDLESMLRSCWEVMSAEMRAHVFAEHRELVETWQS